MKTAEWLKFPVMRARKAGAVFVASGGVVRGFGGL